MAEYIELTEELILSMRAGAMAIANTKKYHGTIYMSDAFSDNPKEMPYLQAAEILYAASEQNPADVAPVRHGRWICKYDPKYGVTYIICSRCRDIRSIDGCYEGTNGESLFDQENYCPNCGAKMEGGSDG